MEPRQLPRYWNPFENIWHNSERTPGPFKRIKKEECQKIASMSLSELFDFIDNEMENGFLDMKMQHNMILLHERTPWELTGTAAAGSYKNGIINILVILRSRLEGKLI